MKSNDPNIPERYKILAELGSGGMGSVYKVHDASLDKILALKVLKFAGNNAGTEIVRFQKEAKAAESLRHENIMRILDFGYHENTTPYMVLEFLEGQTLKNRITQSGALDPEKTIDVIKQLARALSFAHSQKIIHRDLKSENIFLTSVDGSLQVKLFDFGIARTVEENSSMRLTAPNAVIGTPSNMSPEQARGDKADARSDIYSFGCVLFECLTGRLPFYSDNTFGLLDKHMNSEPPKLGSVVSELIGSNLERIVDRCLQKDPAKRFQSASEIIEALDSPLSIENQPVRNSEDSSMLKSNNKMVMIAMFMIAIVGTLIAMNPPRFNNPQSQIPENSPKPKEREIDWSGVNEGMLALREIEDFEADDILEIPRSIGGLDLSGIELPDRLFENISTLDSIQRINLSTSEVLSNRPLSEKNMAALSRMKNLTHLCLQDTKIEDFSNIQSLRYLTTLEASNLSAGQVALLSPLLKLKSLDLRGSKLDEPMLKALGSLSGLKTLVLHFCDPIAVEKLSYLTNLSKLEDLKISDSRSIAKNIAPLTKLKIKTLELRNDGLSDKDAEQIARMSGLNTLKVSHNQFTDTALIYFAKMPNLQSLLIEDCPNLSAGAIAKFKKSAKTEINAAVDKNNDVLDAWRSQKFSKDSNYDPSQSTPFSSPLPLLDEVVLPSDAKH